MNEPQVTGYCPECERLATALAEVQAEAKRYRKALALCCKGFCPGYAPNPACRKENCLVYQALYPEEGEK